jgi:hypothetical protein
LRQRAAAFFATERHSIVGSTDCDRMAAIQALWRTYYLAEYEHLQP